MQAAAGTLDDHESVVGCACRVCVFRVVCGCGGVQMVDARAPWQWECIWMRACKLKVDEQ